MEKTNGIYSYHRWQYGRTESAAHRLQTGGVFEDFYIVPEYRHKGIARQLVRFAYQESGVGSLTVGCADCDVKMYLSLGFTIPLGNLLAFEGAFLADMGSCAFRKV